ncbi:beta-galactosidase trimerization domain-containing protein [Paenibacillus sonchi]|uniref:beta-galactosidase trimerization domain-containing protein n=1 Tax=Paenibacillus sonchi TaxID=373687 RepID=UPI0038CD46E1|nr:beta-galactosidase trimerization domain-containing protein [Paenibacillus sonchi]
MQHWCGILRLEGAEPIAWYEDDFFAGAPAVTVNRFGAGKLYYIGTHAGEGYTGIRYTGILAQAEGWRLFFNIRETKGSSTACGLSFNPAACFFWGP